MSDDILANVREALQKIGESSRVIIVSPRREDAVREAVDASPFPGLFDVTVTESCPDDRVFIVPTLARTGGEFQ